MRKASVFVIEYFSAIRKSIRAVIEGTDDFELVHEAEDCAGLFLSLEITKPDIVLVDVVLPDSDGIEVIKAIKTKCPDIQVIAFSLHGYERYAVEALEAGASDFLFARADLEKKLIALAEVRLRVNRKRAIF